jgi:uncharacterized paraquat-inducible protein A
VLIVRISTIFFLAMLSVQDWRKRQVHWFLFPVLLLLFVYQKADAYQGTNDFLMDFLFPFCFLLLQLAVLTVYVSVRSRRWTMITDGFVGLGDILFFLVLCFYFNLYTYVLFYLISLMLVLIIWPLSQAFLKLKENTIPFAGLQAFFLILVLLYSWIKPVDLRDDRWISLLTF